MVKLKVICECDKKDLLIDSSDMALTKDKKKVVRKRRPRTYTRKERKDMLHNRFLERRARYAERSKMRLEGTSLAEIGKYFGVTREAIRISLKTSFPEIKYPSIKGRKAGIRISIQCGNAKCNKIFMVRPCMKDKKYCNRDCYCVANGFEQHDVPWEKMSQEEKRRLWNKRHGRWIAKVKHLPSYKAYIRKSNRRASLKMWLKKGKINEREYNILYKRVDGK